MTGEKKAKKELLIIIPAYNEANNITKLLEKLESPEIAEIADVLIMNDASSDDTNWIVKARNHTIVTHVFNLGYGSALQLGYKYAIRRGYEYVIQMDADGQHDVCNIPVIYEKLKTKDENGKGVTNGRWLLFGALLSTFAGMAASLILTNLTH